MILFLIVIAAIVVGFYLYTHYCDFEVLGFPMWVGGGIVLIVLICITIGNHAFPEKQITNNNIKYESLIERQKIVNSEYEDYSKSDVIRDIAEWNEWVNTEKSYLDSPWTNALVSKKVIDKLKYIE